VDYYKEIKIRLDKYRKVHAGAPRVAVAKMLLWNIYFLFKGEKKKGNNLYITDSGSLDVKKIERKADGMLGDYFYRQTDNLLELQNEILENRMDDIKSTVSKQLEDKEGDVRRVDTVFITDDNYAMPTAIAISSLYYNANPKTDYRVHVLGIELSEGLSDVIRKSGKNVEVITLGNMFADFNFSHEHVTKAALYKFNIADILSDLDKVLYLDSDMLFQRDLSELFRTDLGDKYAAVVKDLHVMNQKYKGIQKMGLSNYFNSGMMLLNLDKIRKEKIGEKLLATKKKLNLDPDFSFMDQDTFNKVFGENVIFVSVNYNFLNVYYREIEKLDMAEICDISIDEAYEIYDKPAILHIGGKMRPWKTIMGEKALLYNRYIVINRVFRELLSGERG